MIIFSTQSSMSYMHKVVKLVGSSHCGAPASMAIKDPKDVVRQWYMDHRRQLRGLMRRWRLCTSLLYFYSSWSHSWLVLMVVAEVLGEAFFQLSGRAGRQRMLDGLGLQHHSLLSLVWCVFTVAIDHWFCLHWGALDILWSGGGRGGGRGGGWSPMF